MNPKTTQRRIRRKVGDVFSLPLDDGHYAFGRVLEDPLMAVYDFRSDGKTAIEEVVSQPIAFKIWAIGEAITRGNWPVLGNLPLEDFFAEPVWFFKQDIISKRLSLYLSNSNGYEIPATFEQCKDLENVMVWRASRIEDRLRDYFAGRKNISVEASRAKKI